MAVKLIGVCNLCTACCWSADGQSHCAYLQMITIRGTPNAGLCTVYEKRFDGMPIRMIDNDGNEQEPGYVCSKDSLAETMAIIEKGIGRGCSLEVVDGN